VADVMQKLSWQYGKSDLSRSGKTLPSAPTLLSRRIDQLLYKHAGQYGAKTRPGEGFVP
jgi:hypothetical protein